MYLLFVVLMVLAAVLMCFVVLIQNSKGGGLSSSFASSNQIMGVRKTTDFIEKLTWGLAAFMVVISVATSYVVPSQAPAGFAAPQKTDAAATTAPAAVNDSAKN